MNDTTFTVRFYRMGMDNPRRTGDIWLLAANEGDGKYKSAVQQLISAFLIGIKKENVNIYFFQG